MMDSKSSARARENAKTSLPGFSLIEVILYTALFGGMLAVMAAVITIVIQTDAKITAAAEVQEIASFAINRVEHAVSEASGIMSPEFGSGLSLTLSMRDVYKNPTTIEMRDNVLQIVEGSGLTRSNLTSSRVKVTRFEVTRISSAISGAVRIKYTFESNIPTVSKPIIYPFTQTLSLRR